MRIGFVRQTWLGGALLGSLVVTLIVTMDAEQAAPTTRAAPLVTIDFRAVTEDGQPVLDLKATDVTLRVNGRARDIRSLHVVQSAAPSSTSLPPPFASNVISDAGRDVLIVMDDESIAPGREQPLKDGITRLLANLSPRDRVGLLSVRRGGALIGLTSEHSTVRAALLMLRGQASGGQTAVDLVCRTRTTLQALTTILGNIATGSPTTIVFFSAARASPEADRNARMGSGSGLCQLRTEHFQEITQNAVHSQASFYVVQRLDASGSTDNSSGAAGLEHLAGATGGELVRLTGTNATAMDRVTRETSAYYLAGFEAEPAERNGSTQRLELRVARDRVKVRVRPAITMPTVSSRASNPPTPREMLRVADVYRDLPIRAAAYASRNPADEKIKVVTMFEPSEGSVKLTSAAVGLFDAKSRLVAQWTADGVGEPRAGGLGGGHAAGHRPGDHAGRVERRPPARLRRLRDRRAAAG